MVSLPSDKIRVQIPEDVRELAPMYLANRRKELTTLISLRDEKNLVEISKLAHKTKGTAGGYGFDDLGHIAKALDEAAKSNDYDKVCSLVQKWSHYLEQVEISS